MSSKVFTVTAARSPELGVWTHVRENVYAFRFRAFLFDAAGNPTGYQIVTYEVELESGNVNYASAVEAKSSTLPAPESEAAARRRWVVVCNWIFRIGISK